MKKLFQILKTRDPRAALTLLYTGAMLASLEIWWMPLTIQARLDHLPRGLPPRVISLDAGVRWAGASMLGYLLIPLLLQLLVHRQSPTCVGWRLKGFHKHVLVYLAAYLCMLPLLLWASRQESFRLYPYVHAASLDMNSFLIWESAYVLQFFALESFFRGYLLFTLERSIGGLAIFVMAVPYCMIHFHKPAPEIFGALLAGVVLGVLALRFRSWFGGAILHSLVAVTMDSLGAHRAGLF